MPPTPNPLTKIAHQWIAIEVTPVVVFRRLDGSITALADPDGEPQTQVGCELCDATPEDGWALTCTGDET